MEGRGGGEGRWVCRYKGEVEREGGCVDIKGGRGRGNVGVCKYKGGRGRGKVGV